MTSSNSVQEHYLIAHVLFVLNQKRTFLYLQNVQWSWVPHHRLVTNKRTTAVLPPQNALTDLSSCLEICFTLGWYSEGGKWLTCMYSKRNTNENMRFSLFRPTVFGYLFIWTCSASMLKSLQHKETVFLSESFFFPWVLCLQREMGYSLMLINENSFSECPPYKAVSQLSSWLQKEWQLIARASSLSTLWKCFICDETLSAIVLFSAKRASHFPIRSRVQRQDPTSLGSLSVFLGSECWNSRIPSSFGVVDGDCHMLAFFNVLF